VQHLLTSVQKLNAARKAGFTELGTLVVARPDEASLLSATTVSGGWLDEWYANYAESGPDAVFTQQRHVGEVLMPIVQRYNGMEPGGLFGIKITWCGRDAIFARGDELSVRESWPWRVVITLASPGLLASKAAERTAFLTWILAGVVLTVAGAMWVTYRAFRRQAELTRLQSEFVASVSHELRTPVASIGVLAERLEEGRADAVQTAEYHRFIAREGRRLAALVDNVLDFSRIERGAKGYEFEHVDFPRLVSETAALMRPHAEEKGLTLTEDIQEVPEDLWPLVDAVAIRQALVNLLDNAIKFTPSGGTVRVEFSARNRHVTIQVSDTGIGIPASEHTRIFERFHRVDNGLRRETTGAGIGLSIVKHIAEAHGARVTVESEAGRSSVFSIQFITTSRHAPSEH
jgi:signal transduction histidine kinase